MSFQYPQQTGVCVTYIFGRGTLDLSQTGRLHFTRPEVEEEPEVIEKPAMPERRVPYSVDSRNESAGISPKKGGMTAETKQNFIEKQ